MEPKKVIQALEDPSWIEATQEELLQFKLQKVWTLVDLPNGKRAIGTKWVFRNKKDERGIIVRNKARLVAQEEVLCVVQPPGFEGISVLIKVFIGKGDILLVQVYVDDDISLGHQSSLYVILMQLMKKDGIFISQDKYVANILKKFDFATMKTASIPMEPNKALIKDEEADSVDVHLYRSMIGSLMYLTASRPDIMFVVCACVRFQVTPKMSHLHVGASLDRKSTTGGCQFLGKRLISWQCKKQAIVANSTT
ncbi:putative ribonuclease H-like domain-containing protein [Tanacetum coccineum]